MSTHKVADRRDTSTEQMGTELVLRIPECFLFQTYIEPSFSDEKNSPAAATGKEEESGLCIRIIQGSEQHEDIHKGDSPLVALYSTVPRYASRLCIKLKDSVSRGPRSTTASEQIDCMEETVESTDDIDETRE